MKKSELLKKIIERIELMRGVEQPSGSDPYYVYPDDEVMAKMLLDTIEEAGMLPPSYVGLMANGKKYNKETDFGRDLMDVRGEWEPEDET